MRNVIVLMIGFVLGFAGLSYGAGGGVANIQATNTNTNGYMLIGSGTMNGTTQQGIWVNTSTITAPLQTNINNETTARQNADTTLQNNIYQEMHDRAVGDYTSQRNLEDEIKMRNDGDILNKAFIDAEKTSRLSGDSSLHLEVTNETANRVNDDTILQSNINTEILKRSNADTVLQNNINTVDQDSQDRDSQEVVDRINGDKKVQDNVDAESNTRASADQNLQNNINKVNNRVDETNKRVEKLEDTQYNVVGKVRVYDSRKIQVNTFVSYSTNRSTVESAGVEVTWKLGSSYEERRADALEARLNKLEGIQDAKVREASTEVYTTKNGMGIRGTF